MPQYLVTEPLKHNGQSYGPGSDQDTVEMEAKAARELLKLGVLAPAPKAAAQAKPDAKSDAKPKAEAKGKAEPKAETPATTAEKDANAPGEGSGDKTGDDPNKEDK